MLSVQFGDVTVGDCHYHLKTLKDGGVIKLVRSRSVRGATERVYRLAPLPRAAQRAMDLRLFLDVVMPATISAESTPVAPPPANQRNGA